MQNKARLDNYLILKTLGTGYTGKVKLGRDMDTGELRALKILDPTRMDTQKLTKVIKSLENELNVMQNLDHRNIVNFLGLNTKGSYRSKKGVEKRVAYAVIELASKGEIFELLFKVGPFNENMARHYMKQLVSALEYLHSNHVAHRDLKPENLLIDDKMNLKLADFGFATLFEEDQKNKTKLGTERYMSPELVYKKPYSASKADVFAAGVILFIFFSGHPPFHEGRFEDPYYNIFVQRREKFWDFHSKQNKKRVYSESYKALVSGMLESDPDKRLTIEQVRDSAWLNEPLDEAKALEDVAMYFQIITKIVEQTDSMVEEETGNYRALNKSERNMYSLPSKSQGNLLLSEYEKVLTESILPSEITSNLTAIKCSGKTKLIDSIVKTANKIPESKIVWNDTKDSFKIKFTTEHGDIVLVKVSIYEVEGEQYALDLVKSKGPSLDFYQFKARFIELLAGNP